MFKFLIIVVCIFNASIIPFLSDASIIVADDDADDETLVTLSNGAKVRGLTKTSMVNGKKFHQYLSIRYARAERFAHSVMEKPWSGVYDATHHREACPQEDPTVQHSEDCLFLNIFRPIDDDDEHHDVSSKKLKPVMFWIYGGGFTLGSIDGVASVLYDGSLISTMGDVILVEMNYRLGAFGFFYSGTDKAPGNQGIHDQLIALQWVNQNIERFGGDPNQVTVFGESAGSMSTSMLILSPMTKGLFHRAIIQSGTISDIMQFTPEFTLEKSRSFARKCGCEQTDMDEVVECLKQLPTSKLTTAAGPFNLPKMFEGVLPIIMWGDKSGIVPKRPSVIIDNGEYNKIDLMFGFVHDECATIISLMDKELFFQHPPMMYEDVKKRIQNILKKLFFYGHNDELFDFYLEKYKHSLIPFHEVRRLAIEMLSDPAMICPTYLLGHQIAEDMAKRNLSNRVYSFRFDHHSPFMIALGCEKWMGVCHAMDVPYTFGMPIRNDIVKLLFTEKDRYISENVIKAWTKFAHSGNPERMDQVDWPEFLSEDGQSMRQMSINTDFSIVENDYRDRCDKFWKKFILP